MTNERKAELFDKAMDWVYKHLVYADETEYEETLEEIGFTDEEIAVEMALIFVEDEEEE
jgi:sulfur carrier protein ThiS